VVAAAREADADGADPDAEDVAVQALVTHRATMVRRSGRMVSARRYTREPGGAREAAYNEAMTSSGMSKFA
jgi:hypothetical protein